MADHTIIIRKAGAAFECVVRPLPAFNPRDREPMPSYRAAKRAADSLRIVHPTWALDDQVPRQMREAA